MALKILKFRSPVLRHALLIVAAAVACLALYSARLDLAASAAYRGLDPKSPDSRALADWMTDIGNSDPYAHAAAGKYFERTFESNDLERALDEHQKAVANSPNNFWFWVNLGSRRDRDGDPRGAEAAYGRALELAPNYASVAWAYGNSLLRHGKTDEGCSLVARAAVSDPHYANPAAAIGLQIFDGNADEVRRRLGDTADISVAIAQILAARKDWTGSFDAWSHVPGEQRAGEFRNAAVSLLSNMTNAGQIRIAMSISADLVPPGGEKPSIGGITNGGFETPLKIRNASTFEWQLAEGAQPEIGLSETVKRSGRYGLWLSFDAFEAAEFRSIAQEIAVVPGETYAFEGYYRADVKSKAAFRWEFLDHAGKWIGATEPLALNGDWASMRAAFTVPAGTDGIIIRFVRTGCGTTGACPVSGRISFDDFSLKQL